MAGRGRTPFERLLKKQCQKGVTAKKSAGVVGKWGSASFTSLRAANGAGVTRSPAVVSKPKKFFKSRQVDKEEEYEPVPEVTPISVSTTFLKREAPKVESVPDTTPDPAPDPPPPKAARNKFFTSKNDVDVAASVTRTEPRQPIRGGDEVPRIPPLKLRIKSSSSSVVNAVSASSADGSSATRYKLVRPGSASSSSEVSQDEDNDDHEANNDHLFESTGQEIKSKVVEEDVPILEKEVTKVPEEDAVVRPGPLRSYSRKRRNNNEVASQLIPPSLEATTITPGAAVIDSSSATAAAAPEESTSSAILLDSVAMKTEETEDVAAVEDVGNEQNSDPEISFKDESLVIRSPPLSSVSNEVEDHQRISDRVVTEAESAPLMEEPVPVELCLKKSATVAAAENIEKELLQASGPTAKADATLTKTATVSAGGGLRKRAIFKSKAAGNGGQQRKGLSLYKHKWNSGNEDDEFKREVFTRAIFGKPKSTSSSSLDFPDDEDDGSSKRPPPTEMSFAPSKLTRVTSTNAATVSSAASLDQTSMEVVSVKCPKEQKDYYMVIKNVKKAHQIQDSGEFQEFNDDVDYILGGLGAKNSLSTRCLSTVTLASKCMEASFRMHLRAHGTVTKFFAELRDAPDNASLALCAATVLFVLSQDRLNMDLDRDSLELMLNLLDTDSKIKDALDGSGMNKRELEKNKQKVQELVAAMKAKGHAVNLSLDHITADHLSMETLLSLTSKRAGEWFKEELRELGGLDHLVRTLSDCVTFLTVDPVTFWTDTLHSKLKKADRVLKVLENVTHDNEENCMYLLRYREGRFLDLIHTLLKLLNSEVPVNPVDSSSGNSVGHTQRDALLDVIRVYINLVHDYHCTPFGSKLAGEKSDLFSIALHCLFVLPSYFQAEKQFDILVLTLTLLINLVENCESNRSMLIGSSVPNGPDDFRAPGDRDSASTALVKLFLEKEESARVEESRTDNILDGVKEDSEETKEEIEKKSLEERIEETVAKLLHKAGRHMEDTLIGSYVTLIIGYLIIDNKEHEAVIREFLPEQKFEVMVSVLKKFFNFMNLTASATVTSGRGIKATEAIIKHLESIDRSGGTEQVDKAIKVEEEENFDDLTLFDVSKDDSTTVLEDQDNNEPDDVDGKL